MPRIKLDSQVGTAAAEALEPYVPLLYARQGMRIVFIAEMAHLERTQPAPDSAKAPSVKARITHLEVPNAEQEGAIREAMRALYLQRTAAGTFQEDGQLELSEETLRLTGGLLHAIEVARLRAGLAHWASYARRVVQGPDLTVSEMKHELDTIVGGLEATLNAARRDDDSGAV
ncbi:hypothetical protein [Streptomyces sp. DH37]|uniref:hypothetical protein n=1 Tax=Streptomyces sp. DH37 TaxID=3040122 RepID=UPI00244116C9|nr:hypothetical protein [Streptomyces sp. DH37]MDG9703740.1 hypothetical protein [Streptomyces sp. DH37]